MLRFLKIFDKTADCKKQPSIANTAIAHSNQLFNADPRVMLVIVSSAELFFVYPTTVQGYGFSCFHFFYAPVCLSILHSDHCTVVAQASWERANVHEEVKSSFSAVATKDNCRYHINIQTHFLLENYSTFTNFSMEICLGWVIFWLFLQKDWHQ